MSRRLLSLAVFVAIAGSVAVAMGAVAGTPPPRTMTFVDDASGVSFTIQVEVTAPDAGHFVFRAPARGFYVGEAGAAMRALSPTSIVVDYAGPADVRPAIDVAGNITGSVLRPTHLDNVRLQAQIDPAHHTAEVTLTEPAARSHLVVGAVSKANLGPTLASFESALLSNDGAAIYSLMNSDVTSRYTPESFAAYWTAQSTKGAVTALRRVSVSDARTTDNGISYVIATYEVAYRMADGSTGTTTLDTYFGLQNSAWKVLFTKPR